MGSIWKTKVMPKIKKFFDKGKKKGASEVCKNFDKSKESLDKEIAEKGADLNPKVVEIYRSSSTFIAKKLLKEPNEGSVKGNPDAVQTVLQELVKVGFPGAEVICDAGTKFGPALLPGPVVYLFEKASVYLVEEPLPEEPKEETRDVTVEDVKSATAEAPVPAPPPPAVPAAEPDAAAAAAAPMPEPEAAAAAKEEEEEEAEKVEVKEPAATTQPTAEAAAEVPATAAVSVAAAAVAVATSAPAAADPAPGAPAPPATEAAAAPPAPEVPPPAAEKTE